MRHRSSILLWAGIGLILWSAPAVWSAERVEGMSWPEGTLLKGVDGSVVHADSNDLWCFEVGSDVNEPALRVPKGTRFALLPSATLAHLVADVNDRQLPRYRLTGQVTQYHGANFLWLAYFLPLSKLKDANEPAPGVDGIVDPNAVAVETMDSAGMKIPAEIAERLRTRRVARGPQRAVTPATPADAAAPKVSARVLVDVVGYIERRQDATLFVPDALGQNVTERRYVLLPCRALERAEQKVAAWPEPVRVKVAGVATEYQGKKVLLLQRMIRVYNYGNFGG